MCDLCLTNHLSYTPLCLLLIVYCIEIRYHFYEMKIIRTIRFRSNIVLLLDTSILVRKTIQYIDRYKKNIL